MSGKILSFTAFIVFISAFDVEIERPEVKYYDKELFKNVTCTVRRLSRHDPYIVNLDIYSLWTVGNNVTVHIQLYENLSGRYLPTLVTMHWKLCDFYEKEPFMGQMISKQFPPNMSCPFKPGLIHIPAVEINFHKFPYTLPFTWTAQTIRVRMDMIYYITDTKQIIGDTKFYAKVIMNSKTDKIKSNR